MIDLYSRLEEISFIAGSREVIFFEIFDNDNKPVDLENMTISWNLSMLGFKDNPVLVKPGIVSELNKFRVQLDEADTINLRGRFIHQPIIKDIYGHVYRPAEGLINIVESIKE